MITAMVSKKGGVGKTTTSVNLAAALAGIGKKVLLIDLDSQASASLSMGVPRESLAPSSADIVLRNASPMDLVRETRTPGLHMITASADLSTADQTLGMVSGRELILHRALEPAREEFDFILLDCPSTLSLVPVNALMASDTFIVPVVPHFLAWEGVSNLLSTAARLYERLGRRTELLGIVLTMVDYRTKAARINVDAIRQKYKGGVFAIEIRTNTRLAEAPAAGQTIFEYDPTATGAKAYRLLAAEVLIRATSQRRGPWREAPALDEEPVGAAAPPGEPASPPPGEPEPPPLAEPQPLGDAEPAAIGGPADEPQPRKRFGFGGWIS